MSIPPMILRRLLTLQCNAMFDIQEEVGLGDSKGSK